MQCPSVGVTKERICYQEMLRLYVIRSTRIPFKREVIGSLFLGPAYLTGSFNPQ